MIDQNDHYGHIPLVRLLEAGTSRHTDANNVENLPEYANEPSNIWVAGSTSEPHKSETAGNLARQQPVRDIEHGPIHPLQGSQTP